MKFGHESDHEAVAEPPAVPGGALASIEEIDDVLVY